MTHQILVTIARAALSGSVIPQTWTCDTCGQEMDITEGLAHILFDCQPAAVCPICKGQGVYTGINQETGHVGPMRCLCQEVEL